MTPEQHVWAVALWVEKHHGTHGPGYIAEQIGRLALAGDEAGVAMWKKIAARYNELLAESEAIAPTGDAA